MRTLKPLALTTLRAPFQHNGKLRLVIVVGAMRHANPRADIPKLLSLYRDGSLMLDELVTRTYTLDQINDGYEDMRTHRNIRGLVLYD